MSDKTFWNDETAKEFVLFYNSHKDWVYGADPIMDKIREFKQSKQPKEDYTILSFRVPSHDNHIIEIINGNAINNQYSVEKYLKGINSVKDGWCEIFSVLRHSDNEVFTLGDVTGNERYYYKPIKRFFIKDGLMYVQFDEGFDGNDGCLTINSIQKVKQRVPLFTTEDGVELFGGEYTYGFDENYEIQRDICHNKFEADLLKNSKEKIFANIEKAEQYRLENKPIQVSFKQLTDYVHEIQQKENALFTFQAIKNFFSSKI